MANNLLSTSTGAAELKDNYGQESVYEAIRRRRAKRNDKLEIPDKDLEDDVERIRDQFPKP